MARGSGISHQNTVNQVTFSKSGFHSNQFAMKKKNISMNFEMVRR